MNKFYFNPEFWSFSNADLDLLNSEMLDTRTPPPPPNLKFEMKISQFIHCLCGRSLSTKYFNQEQTRFIKIEFFLNGLQRISLN